MKKKYAGLFMLLFSIIATAESKIDVSGSLNVTYDEFVEVDQEPNFSMNGSGNLFGEGDWKQSTNDNSDDNTEKFQATVDINADIQVNENVKVYANFETLTENFTGITNGDEVTNGQEAKTVRDNDYLFLKELSMQLNSEYAEIVITNSFNYNINDRVLATQLDDNWGEETPYGEGIYAKTKFNLVDGEFFMFQSSDKDSDTAQEEYIADYSVYGTKLSKDFNMFNLDLLAVNTHDKSTENSGATAGKDLDVQHYAINAEVSPMDMLSIKAEYITAQYGEDVTQMYNFSSSALTWTTDYYDLSTDDKKADNSLYEVSAAITPIDNVKVNLGYKNVGEDYYAVLGNGRSVSSALGNAALNTEYGNSLDYRSDGAGYEKGIYGDVSYFIPGLPVNVENIISFKSFENTKTFEDDAEDNLENELKAVFKSNVAGVGLEAACRLNTLTNDEQNLDITFNELGLKGNYKLAINDKTSNTFGAFVGYYTGDDNEADQNFSTEKKFKFNSLTQYKYSDKVTLSALYRFGYAMEDNDLFEGATGMQNLIKTGLTYNFGSDTNLDLFYKYDNYVLDRDVTADELSNSEQKKEKSHVWYDGSESWASRDADYEGYATHEIGAKLTVRF